MKYVPENFRIVSDGEKFRVQERQRFLWWHYWTYDSYQPRNYKSREEAQQSIDTSIRLFGPSDKKFKPV